MSSGKGANLSEKQKIQYNSYVLAAKDFMCKNYNEKALDCYRKAYNIYPSDKLEAKITRLVKNLSINAEGSSSEHKRPCPYSPAKLEDKRHTPSVKAMGKENKDILTQKAAVETISNSGHIQGLLSEARIALESENIQLALELYQKAYMIQPDEKIQRRINRMQAFLGQTAVSLMAEATQRYNSEGSPQPDLVDSNNKFLEKDLPMSNNMIKSEPVHADLMSEAKKCLEAGDVESALNNYMEAYKMEPSEKLCRRIERMQTYLNNTGKNLSFKKEIQEINSDFSSSSKDILAHNNLDLTTSTPRRPVLTHKSATLTPKGSPITDMDTAIYNSLITQAKVVLKDGKVSEAEELYRQAYRLHQNEKLLLRIQRLQALSASSSGNKKLNAPDCLSSQSSQDLHSDLIAKARQFLEGDNPEEALQMYEKAQKIKPSEKLLQRINKLKLYIQKADTEGCSQQQDLGKSMTDAERYNNLISEAKALVIEDKVSLAQRKFQEAYELKPSNKLKGKIEKCQEYLQNNQEDAMSQDFSHVGNNFFLHKDLYSKLYPHQKESLLWFWGLHQKKTGGILADDMGLGKTIQVISFLCGLFDAEEIKSVLIVMPLSLIENWRKEFQLWAPGIQIEMYHGGSARERAKTTAKIQRRGGVLLTSYGMIVSAAELLAKKDGESFGQQFCWDYVILDEGHKIKNPTKTSKGVHAIAAKHRIILTGTPIQNNLKELWALFNWTHHGMLLGNEKTFKSEFERPITRAREKCATFGEKRLGEQMAESLRQLIAPYFLRRTKQEVKAKAVNNQKEKGVYDGPKMPTLTRKNDFVVWCFLSDLQKKIYESFISQDDIKELLNTSKSPLTALVVLKKICDHPRLMSNNACAKLGLFLPEELTDADDSTLKDCAANRISSVDDEILIAESGKLVFLVQLMGRLKLEGHRTLIFSQSRKMLDIIQKVLANRGHMIIRLDGTIQDLTEREKCVKTFQSDARFDTFLLTTQVGGVGLTLTAADRVVIFDPSWNPATDSQAVDRAFRIGQQKNVVIYRFISCATVEEKIYRRQVFKDSVTRQTMQQDSKNLYRYFTKTELRELFQLDDVRVSKTQQQLEQMHTHQRVSDIDLDEHIAFLYSCDMFGISDHDLMFSQAEEEAQEGDENVEYITKRVTKALELVTQDSKLQAAENAKLLSASPRALAVSDADEVRREMNDSPTEILIKDEEYESYITPDNVGVDFLPTDAKNGLQVRASDVVSQKFSGGSPLNSVNQSVHPANVNQSFGQRDQSFNQPNSCTKDCEVTQFNDSHISAQEYHAREPDAEEKEIKPMTDVSREVSGQASMGVGALPDYFAHPHTDVLIKHSNWNVATTDAVQESKQFLQHFPADLKSSDGIVSNADQKVGEINNQSQLVSIMQGYADSPLSLQASEVDGHSIDAEVLADDSNDKLDDTQSESMLGESFGHLHADYTVKDSGDESSFSMSQNRTRRSTFLQPVKLESDDEDDYAKAGGVAPSSGYGESDVCSVGEGDVDVSSVEDAGPDVCSVGEGDADVCSVGEGDADVSSVEDAGPDVCSVGEGDADVYSVGEGDADVCSVKYVGSDICPVGDMEMDVCSVGDIETEHYTMEHENSSVNSVSSNPD